MALTKQERDALPESDFAVPGKRALPMHDAKHVRMAWSQVDHTGGLSDAERHEARHRILDRARALSMDTSDWSTLKAMSLQAMSLNVPKTEGHPNKMPFSGVLTFVDQPSDAAPHGSNKRRVLLPKAVAESALSTLLGMAVDYTPSFNGHDAQKKIGLIDEAEIVGDEIRIGGFIYAADFPDAAARIKADKDTLGFSFEMKNVQVADPGADPLVIESCVFTGAAILRKLDAAYTSTSLAASHDRPEIDMTKEELQEVLAAALKPVNDEIASLKAGQDKVAADLQAGKETHAKIKPHADALRACSAAMEAAGVGGHATKGPSAHLNRMADRFEADAMVGKLPHIYRDHDFFVDASAETVGAGKADPAIAELKSTIEALGTKVSDLSTKAFNAAREPERKTVPVELTALLAKHDINASADAKVSVAKFDEILASSNLDRPARITLKLKARESGLLQDA